MAIASLVLGIVCVILSLIPIVGWFIFLPAIVGLILGIVALVRINKDKSKSKKGDKGKSIAGIILNAVSMVIVVFLSAATMALLGAIGVELEKSGDLDRIKEEIRLEEEKIDQQDMETNEEMKDDMEDMIEDDIEREAEKRSRTIQEEKVEKTMAPVQR